MKKVLAIITAALVIFTIGCRRSGVSSTDEGATFGTVMRQKPTNDLKKTNEDTLNIGFVGNGKETNPFKVKETAMVNLLWLSYDSMFVLGNGGEMETSLVESYKANDDGSFDFTLRSGITFHDGSALKADHIVYSVSVIKAGGGEDEARSTVYANVKDIIKSVTAVNERVVKMEFNDGGISPLYVLTFPITNKNGSGTGLYKMDSSDNSGMTFSYYEGSWKKQPNIKKISAKRFADEETMAKAYKENTIDAVFAHHSNVGNYKYTKNTKTMNVRTNDFYYLLPNLKSGVMSNLKMRQTLSYAFDKESIVSRTFDSNAVVSDFPIPSEFFIFDNELLNYSKDIGKCLKRFNELGYTQVKEGVHTYMVKDDKRFTIKIIGLKDENLYHRIIAETVKAELSDIGVVCDVVLLNAEDYEKALKNREFDIAVANTELSSEFDFRYLLSKNGDCNFNGINNTEIDSALKNIAAIKNDPSKVKDEYVKLQEQMVKTIPMIGLCFVTDTFVYSDRLGNVGRAYSNLNMLSDVAFWSFESTETATVEQRAD